jgi:hypothetical protein
VDEIDITRELAAYEAAQPSFVERQASHFCGVPLAGSGRGARRPEMPLDRRVYSG